MEIQTHAANGVVRKWDRFDKAFKYATFVDLTVTSITWWENGDKAQNTLVLMPGGCWAFVPPRFSLTHEEWDAVHENQRLARQRRNDGDPDTRGK